MMDLFVMAPLLSFWKEGMYRNKVLKNFKCAQPFCLIITVVNGISKKTIILKAFFTFFCF